MRSPGPRNPAIKPLLDELADVQQRQTDVRSQLELVQSAAETLQQLIDFSAEASAGDLGRGVLQSEALVTLADYTFKKQQEFSERQLALKKEIEQLTSRQAAIQSQLAKLRNAGARIGQRAIVFVDVDQAEPAATVRLRYLVASCGWDPQYNVHGDSAAGAVELEFNAVVRQGGGEDWNEVELSLSTASPWIRASRPQLTPFRVTSQASDPSTSNPFGDGSDAPSKDQQQIARSLLELRSQRKAANAAIDQSSSPQGGFGQAMGTGMTLGSPKGQRRDILLNSLAAKLQHLELESDAAIWRRVADDSGESLGSRTYPVKQLVTLPSQFESQIVRVNRSKMEADFYHVATPLLSSFAYREAEVLDTPGLLGGPAATYLDGRFVGSTDLPTTANGQRLVLGFGADQQIRTRRELVEKAEEIKGGNRQIRFTYKLVLANFKDEAVPLRLLDRMPLTRQQQQLAIRLEEPVQPLSTDGLYNRVSRPLGVLRWDLELEKQRHGSAALDVVYSYTIEFDRSRRLVATNLEDIAGDIDAAKTGGMGLGGTGGFGGGAP